MKNSKKGFIVPLLIIIVAIIAIGCGAYYYTQKSQGISTSVSTPTTSSNSTSKNLISTPPSTKHTTENQTLDSTDSKNFDDSDLRVAMWSDKNADCQEINSISIPNNIELNQLVKSTSTIEVSSAIQSLVDNNSIAINTYLKGGYLD